MLVLILLSVLSSTNSIEPQANDAFVLLIVRAFLPMNRKNYRTAKSVSISSNHISLESSSFFGFNQLILKTYKYFYKQVPASWKKSEIKSFKISS